MAIMFHTNRFYGAKRSNSNIDKYRYKKSEMDDAKIIII